jgi:hypothetical protein
MDRDSPPKGTDEVPLKVGRKMRKGARGDYWIASSSNESGK